jgi:hypothetical protein
MLLLHYVISYHSSLLIILEEASQPPVIDTIVDFESMNPLDPIKGCHNSLYNLSYLTPSTVVVFGVAPSR